MPFDLRDWPLENQLAQRLFVTKISPPQSRSDQLPRPRLSTLLDQGLEGKLILVSSPPGFGKSTLLANWISSSTTPAAWFSIDETDNDATVFFRYLIAAIQTLDRGLCTESAQLAANPEATSTREIAASLVNDLAAVTRPCLVVFDDFHLIVNPEILEGVASVVRHAPPTLRVIFSTRNDPPLPLMQMRARGELLEVRAADLAFTEAEMRVWLCDMLGLNLSALELKVLHTWTEGWPVAITLVGRALSGPSSEHNREVVLLSGGSTRSTMDYLWSNALEQLPESVTNFLLQTSVLKQFNASLCAAVTGTQDAADILANVEVANLFLAVLASDETWYRYHHLFAGYLQEQLKQRYSNEETSELHRRSARWYRANGFPEEAAHHAIAANDWDMATTLLLTICERLDYLDRWVAIHQWLSQLPNEVIQAEPYFGFLLTWASLRLGFKYDADALDTADRAWSQAENHRGMARMLLIRSTQCYLANDVDCGLAFCSQSMELLGDGDELERARAYIIRGYLHLKTGNVSDAEVTLARGRSLVQKRENRSLQIFEMNATAIAFHMRAKLHTAADLFQQVTLLGDDWNHPQVQHAYWALAGIQLEWNQFDTATDLLMRTIEIQDRIMAPWHGVRVHRLLAEVAWAKGNSALAFQEAENALQVSQAGGFQDDVRDTRALLARFWMDSGQMSLARSWALETDLDPFELPPYIHLFEYLALLRVTAVDGDHEPVLAMLNQLQCSAQGQGRLDDLLHILLLRSAVADLQGDVNISVASLAQALEIGATEGYVRSFVNAGQSIVPSLNRIVEGGGLSRRYAQLILDLLSDNSNPSDVPGRLSRREIQVLDLSANGMSVRELADILFVSESTVKKHLSNIYSKLQVANRMQAIEVARRANLF